VKLTQIIKQAVRITAPQSDKCYQRHEVRKIR